MANNNFSSFDFMMSNLYRGNLNTNTRNSKKKQLRVKMGDPVGMHAALRMTSTGNGARNAAIVKRRCLTKDDMYGDRVDHESYAYFLSRSKGLEQIDKGSPKNPNFLQRCWKAIVNSPASFLVPLTEMLEPITSSEDTPKVVKSSAKTVLFFGKLYLGQNKSRPNNLLFHQLVGLDEPKQEMKMIKSCILGSGGSNELTPPGVLLHGPSGTGKTSLVHALAREANVTFLRVAGEALAQDEKGFERLKSIFTEARMGAPSIIFIDGVEAVKAVTHLEYEINKCMVDGIVVIVVATAVNVDKINPGLMKLFTVACCLEKPDLQTRVKMAEVLLKKMTVAEEDKETILKSLADETSGFVWSDLELVCKKSCVLAKYKGDVGVLVTKEHVTESLKAVKALHALQNAAKESKKAKKKEKKEKKKAEKTVDKANSDQGKEDVRDESNGKVEALETENGN